MKKTLIRSSIRAFGCDATKIMDILSKSHYKSVSFDVFDTLILRRTLSPDDIFKIVENLYRNQFNKKLDFLEKRKKAEQRARAKGGEASLLDIYSQLEVENQDEVKWLYITEMQVEKSVCFANAQMKEVYDFCINNGMDVFIISDMYLDKEAICELLEEAGYSNWIDVLVSSEFKCTKAEGELFERFIKKFQIDRKSHVHIGDALVSDFISPRKQRINSLLYSEKQRNIYFSKKEKQNLPYLEIANFINKTYATNENIRTSAYEEIGFEVLGPILYGFSKWIEEKCKERNIKYILFLAREGYLLENAYKAVSNDLIPSEVILVSRRAVSFPLLQSAKSLDDVIRTLNIQATKFSVRSFIDYLRLYDKTIQINASGINGETVLASLNQKEKTVLFDSIKVDLWNKSKKQLEYLTKYLEPYSTLGNVAVVDVGWHGTIQNAIKECIPNLSVFGLYLGDDRDVISNNSESLIFDYKKGQDIRDHIMATSGLFELMFLSVDGSAIEYSESDGKICCIKDRPEHNEIQEKKIMLLQQAAMSFVRGFNNSKWINYSLGSDALMANYICMINSTKAINAFREMDFNNSIIEKIVPSKSILEYIMSPKELFRDFNNSSSRGIFLRKLLPLPMNYDRLLGAMHRKKKRK